MTPADNQRYAVAKLVGYCEGIVRSGVLGEALEAKMRLQVNDACTEFGMPTEYEMLSAVDEALNQDDGAPSTPEELAQVAVEMDAEIILNSANNLKKHWDAGRLDYFSLKVLLMLSDALGVIEGFKNPPDNVVDLRTIRRGHLDTART